MQNPFIDIHNRFIHPQFLEGKKKSQLKEFGLLYKKLIQVCADKENHPESNSFLAGYNAIRFVETILNFQFKPREITGNKYYEARNYIIELAQKANQRNIQYSSQQLNEQNRPLILLIQFFKDYQNVLHSLTDSKKLTQLQINYLQALGVIRIQLPVINIGAIKRDVNSPANKRKVDSPPPAHSNQLESSNTNNTISGIQSSTSFEIIDLTGGVQGNFESDSPAKKRKVNTSGVTSFQQVQNSSYDNIISNLTLSPSVESNGLHKEIAKSLEQTQLNLAALDSQRRITAIKSSGTYKTCRVIPSTANGDCGFIATQRYLQLTQQSKLSQQLSRENFIKLVEDLSKIQTSEIILKKIQDIFNCDGAKDISDWKAKFVSSSYYLQAPHFALLSVHYDLKFIFYYLPPDDKENFFCLLPYQDTICENKSDHPLEIPLAYISTHIRTEENDLNHFEAILIEPTLAQEKIIDAWLQNENAKFEDLIQTENVLSLENIASHLFTQPSKRAPLPNNEYLESILKQQLPSHLVLGTSYNQGDCFFDSLSQYLNNLRQTDIYTAKNLRELCYAYYLMHKNEVYEWDKKDAPHSKQDYCDIRYTEQECKDYFEDKSPIWGRPLVEGRILCHQVEGLNAICVIEILEDPESKNSIIAYYKVTRDGSCSIKEEEVNEVLNDPYIPKLVVEQKSLHFVPLLDKNNAFAPKKLAIVNRR